MFRMCDIASELLVAMFMQPFIIHSVKGYDRICCYYFGDVQTSIILASFILCFMNLPRYFLLACNNAIDVGFIADFSSSTTLTDEQLLASIKRFIIDVMSPFHMSDSGPHFSYMPFSTFPGDYSPNQWFNNTIVKGMNPDNNTVQIAYLEDVIQLDPAVDGFERGKHIFIERLFKRLKYELHFK